jgi:hypothetical protein
MSDIKKRWQLEDIEIYDLATRVLGEITQDLNESIYAKLDGELTIGWHEGEVFGAFASTLGEIGKPPKHRVTIHYELARRVWRDAEDICKFLRSIPKDSDTDKLYDFYGDRVKLPTCFNDEDIVRNMFFAAITWVYFHEIGHLMQEHGVIRKEFVEGGGGTVQATDVCDFEASNNKRLVGREALVSHVTELAADFEATSYYVMELLRHVTAEEFADDDQRIEVLSGLIYLMVCGLSLVFFRFNGSQPILPTTVVEGSHPPPLTRLEINVTQIFEGLDMLGKAIDHGLDRKHLVFLCAKAALSATLYWSMTKSENHRLDDRFLLKGILSNPVVLEYLQPIVACWDEILPRIQEVRRFDSPLSSMTFTDSFRMRIATVSTWGNGPEGNSAISLPPDAIV